MVVRQSISPTSSDRPSGPLRTCVGCRGRAAKRELLRVTAGSDAQGHPAVVPDPTSTALGRGAHLHPTSACYDLAVRRKAFGRALHADVGLSSTPVGDYLTTHSQKQSSDDQKLEQQLMSTR